LNLLTLVANDDDKFVDLPLKRAYDVFENGPATYLDERLWPVECKRSQSDALSSCKYYGLHVILSRYLVRLRPV
jgi:hypothetical protein